MKESRETRFVAEKSESKKQNEQSGNEMDNCAHENKEPFMLPDFIGERCDDCWKIMNWEAIIEKKLTKYYHIISIKATKNPKMVLMALHNWTNEPYAKEQEFHVEIPVSEEHKATSLVERNASLSGQYVKLSFNRSTKSGIPISGIEPVHIKPLEEIKKKK